MKKQSPISVTKILTAIHYDNDPFDHEFQAFEFFENRNEFLISRDFATLSLSIDFLNEKMFTSLVTTGQRRKVTVSLFDETINFIWVRRLFNVCFNKSTVKRTYQVDLPLLTEDDGFVLTNSFRIIVRDEATGLILADRPVKFWDVNEIGNSPEKLYTVPSAFIACTDVDHSVRPYMSIVADDYAFHTVRFSLMPQFEDISIRNAPQLEIVLYYPDGTTERSICKPQQDKFDVNYDDNRWHVEMRFCVRQERVGVIYAELRCMGKRISGFLFSTEGPEYFGAWYKQYLDYCTDYTPADGAKRFQELLIRYNDDDDYTDLISEPEENDKSDKYDTDLEFEKLLMEFVDSSLKEDSEEENNEVPEEPTTTVDDSSNFLDNLSGLEKVKTRLATYEKIVRFNSMRIENGLTPLLQPLHAMFLGSPGTGKTTVAKYIGKLLADAGILSKGHVVVKERATLLGQNYNSESEKTLEALNEAKGGILFIDEAYQLYQPQDPRDPGKFVLETLMTALADDSDRDWMLLLAGYPEPLKKMLDMNPGLKSRIPESNIYLFDDFTDAELVEIAENYLSRHHYTLTLDARTALETRLKADSIRLGKSFGNARHVINLIQTEILPAMAVRVTSGNIADVATLSEIQVSDIPQEVTLTTDTHKRIGFVS